MVDGLCLFDVDAYGRELDDPLQELYQDLVHRLLEAPRSNPADEDRGVGIFNLLSRAVSVAAIKDAIQADFLKDDRVQYVSTTITPLDEPGFYNLDIQVVCNEGNLGISLDVNADGTVRKAA